MEVEELEAGSRTKTARASLDGNRSQGTRTLGKRRRSTGRDQINKYQTAIEKKRHRSRQAG